MRTQPVRPQHIALLQVLSTSSTLTEAARRLNVTQPAVSKQLALLEDALGYRLFERSGHSLRPKPEARALLDQVDRVSASLSVLNDLAIEFRHVRPGHLQIGCIASAAIHLLPHALRPLQREHPELMCTVHTGNTQQVVHWVDTQQVDIAVALKVNDADKWHFESLLPFTLACLMPRDHALAALDAVSAADLQGWPVIGIELPSVVWAGAGQPWWDQELSQVQTRVDSAQVACTLAANGLGVAVADSLTVAAFTGAHMTSRPFRNAMRAEVGIYQAIGRPDNAVKARLAAGLREHAVRLADEGVLAPA